MYYTVIKHDGHLRTRGKCRQHSPVSRVFNISRVFSNVLSVLSQCNTRLRLLHLLYDIEVMWQKTIKHAFSMFHTLIKHGFLTNQSARTILSIERFSNDCRKTKTKAISPTNHNRTRQHDEPITIPSNSL